MYKCCFLWITSPRFSLVGGAPAVAIKLNRRRIVTYKIVCLRQIIRIDGSYYLGLPKSFLTAISAIRGTQMLMKMEGNKIVAEVAQDGMRDVWREKK